MVELIDVKITAPKNNQEFKSNTEIPLIAEIIPNNNFEISINKWEIILNGKISLISGSGTKIKTTINSNKLTKGDNIIKIRVDFKFKTEKQGIIQKLISNKKTTTKQSGSVDKAVVVHITS